MQKNRETTIYKPTFKEVQHGWFVHKGDVYSVATCDSSLFRSAILALHPTWIDADIYGPMLRPGGELDIMGRWFLLSELEAHKRAYRGMTLTLYASHQDARNKTARLVAIVR